MVFGKLLEFAENEGRRLVPDLFHKKKLCQVKPSGPKLSFNVFQQSSNWTYNKINLKLDYYTRDIFNFDSLEKGLGSSTIFCVWFFKKNVSHVTFN